MKTLPEISGSGFRLVNRTVRVMKTANGRTHEITSETLISADYPNGLHRASGGGIGFSKKYFADISSQDASERDARLARWLLERPELKEQ